MTRSTSLVFVAATLLAGCTAGAPSEPAAEGVAADTSTAGSPDDLFRLPNSFCTEPGLTKDEAIARAGTTDGPGIVLGHFPVYQRERICNSEGACGAWGPASPVPGPYRTSIRAYTEFGPRTEVVFETTTSGVAVECDHVGEGCQSEGRMITGTVAADCFWLLQSAPSIHGQIQWVATGHYGRE